MLLTALPNDVLIIILQSCAVPELVALSSSCTLLNSLVTEFGWAAYLRTNPRPSFSLSQSRKTWSAREQVHYDFLVDRSWSSSEFIARPLSKPWPGKRQPVMAVSPSRLVIAAGSDITSYNFGVCGRGESPSVRLEGSFSFSRLGRSSVITSMDFIEDGLSNETLCLGFQDGVLEQISLNPPSSFDTTSPSFGVTLLSSSQLPGRDYIESLSSERGLLLSLSSSGIASLKNMQFSLVEPTNVALDERSWASHLCLDSSGPYAAFGTSSTRPLRVHSIENDGFSHNPIAILHATIDPESISTPVSSAVYGISRAPFASPWGASPQILVSGWFDGQVRCHDLRSSRTTRAGLSVEPALLPVLTMNDPGQSEPFYSVSCGGGSSSYVAAGSSRHSVVSFWDIRFPSAGWSVYAPGSDRSPVYEVILESSRLFGVTHSRPFVYDFGPGIDSGTYPELPQGQVDGLRRKKTTSKFGYYVTTYPHRTQRIF